MVSCAHMSFVFPIIAGLFGLIIGSFLNVVVLRSGTGRSLGGRSGCPSCGHVLNWYELIPVVSWVIQKGRCRSCGSKISIQYPLVESITAIIFFLVVYLARSEFDVFIGLLAGSILIAIAVYDIKHTIIPDRWVYAFNLISLAASLTYAVSLQDALFTFLGGIAIAFPLFALWLVSKGTWMGFGDVKLALGIGWLLGTLYGLVALYLAFVIGAIVSVCILMPLPRLIKALHSWGIIRLNSVNSRFTMKSEVPFGPFLVVGCMLTWGLIQTNAIVPFFS